MLPTHAALLMALETPTGDPMSFLINYGVAGVVILLLVTGQLRTKSEVAGLQKALEDTRTDLVAERSANAALVAQMTQHTLPQMAALADVLERLPKNDDTDLRRQIDDLRATLSALQARNSERP